MSEKLNNWWKIPGKTTLKKLSKYVNYSGEEVKSIFVRLKEIFNEEWVETQLKLPWGHRHDLVRNVFGVISLNEEKNPRMHLETPHVFANVWEIGKNLEELKDVDNIGKLIRRLHRRADFHGARFELEVAANLKRSGFDEIELYPDNSDIRARVNGTWVYFEVSHMQLPEDYEKWNTAFRQISLAVGKRLTVGVEAYIYFEIEKIPPKFEHKKIQREIVKVLSDDIFPRIIQTGDVEIKIVRSKDPMRGCIGWWNKEEEVVFSDEEKRTIGKIIKKKKQIPKEEVGVVVIHTSLPLVCYSEIEKELINIFCVNKRLLGIGLVSSCFSVNKGIERSARFFKNFTISREYMQIVNKLVMQTKNFLFLNYEFI